MENQSGKATDVQVQQWKKAYGEVFEASCDGKFCYLRKPDRKTLSAATAVGQSDPMKFNEVILNTCFIGGFEGFKTDDSLFLAVCGVLDAIVEIKQAQIKKL